MHANGRTAQKYLQSNKIYFCLEKLHLQKRWKQKLSIYIFGS